MSDLDADIRELAKLFSDASRLFERIADGLKARTPPQEEPKAAAPAAPPAPETIVPWNDLVARAIDLLKADPQRTWRSSELVHGIRDTGVELPSWQGIHFGLTARLRRLDAVIDSEEGFSAAPRLLEPEAPRREFAWAQLVPRAHELLVAEPARWWTQAELCRAIVESGIAVESTRGMHLGLIPRLRAARKIEENDEGRLRFLAGSSSEPLPTAIGATPPVPTPSSPPPSAPSAPAATLLGPSPPALLDRAAPAAAPSAPKLAVGAPPTRPTSVAPPSAPPPAAPSLAFDEVAELTEEIDECEFLLERQDGPERHAQVSLWAGRARAIQDGWGDDPNIEPGSASALRRVFGRLTRIAREHPMGWISALTREWTIDWDAHQAYYGAQLAGEEPELDAAANVGFWQAMLRALWLPNRRVAHSELIAVIAAASAALEAGDPVLAEARQRFGLAAPAAPIARQRAPEVRPHLVAGPEAATRAAVPSSVLGVTRGRRALLLGGQGAREESRRKLQDALELKELDWEWSERGAAGHYDRIAERVRNGSYDLVLFLAGYTSHKSQPVLRQCKASRVPLVYLARGYSLSSVVSALEAQAVTRQQLTDTRH